MSKDDELTELGNKSIPNATVARLPLYLRCLTELPEGKATISSDELAELAGVNAAKVRKDFSFIGFSGVRGHGYDVADLQTLIQRELGLTQEWSVALAGIGHLGMALANYKSFSRRGFSIVALFDNDEEKIGANVGDLTIEPLSKMHELVSARNISMGVIATPPQVAQSVFDAMVSAGIRAVLNFAPITLVAPDYVMVRKVDLSLELQILGYYSMRSDVENVQAKIAPLRPANSRSESTTSESTTGSESGAGT